MGDHQADYEGEAVMGRLSQTVRAALEHVRGLAASAPQEFWVLMMCGVLVAASAWLLLGWERADAREALVRWKAAALAEAGLLL